MGSSRGGGQRALARRLAGAIDIEDEETVAPPVVQTAALLCCGTALGQILLEEVA